MAAPNHLVKRILNRERHRKAWNLAATDKRLNTLRAIDAVRDNDVLPTAMWTEVVFGVKMLVDMDELASQKIMMFDCFEPGLTTFFLKEFQKGDVFYDVGAHYGYFSLLASERVGKAGHVVSIEPTGTTYKNRLKKNMAGRENSTCLNIAAWSSDTELALQTFGRHRSAFNSVVAARMEGDDREQVKILKVPGRTLDNIASDIGRRPTHIKIDAESAELEILKGAAGIIQNDRPIITVEVGDYEEAIDQGAPRSRDILSFLKAEEFTLYEPEIDGISAHDIDMEADYTYGNIVAVPSEAANETFLDRHAPLHGERLLP